MTVIDKLKEVSAFLKSKGIEDAAKEAAILITETLHISKSKLYAGSFEISEDESKQIDALASRRAHREPLQYILGYVEFYGMKIKVGPGVLIPRPETELMVEEVITIIRSQKQPPHPPLGKGGLRGGENSEFQTPNSRLGESPKETELRILDLCTGSGCLALAIAKHFPEAEVYGTDISEEAINYARDNAALNGIKNVTFLKGSLFEPIKEPVTFDVIVSNPPYIKSSDITNLQPEIKNWEPLNALDGGEDGLKYYREILSKAKKYLIPPAPPLEKGGKGGFVFLEIGEGQAKDIIQIAEKNMFTNISIIKDYAGIERIILMSTDNSESIS